MPTKVAVIQTPPVLRDRKRTIAQALASIEEETSIPGYPHLDLAAVTFTG